LDNPGFETVLIVVADILVRHPLAEYLRECGYRVIEAATSIEARAFLDTADLQIDVFFGDVDADSGFALARWVRENRHQVVVVQAGSLKRATETAADLCQDGPALSKPYEHHLVYDRIKRLLAARTRSADPTRQPDHKDD
jgi:DNA-binding response OmpR family regulator